MAPLDLDAMTWTCHVCDEERPNRFIAVHTTDISADYGLKPGVMSQNIRFCLDRPTCESAAKTLRLDPAGQSKNAR